MKFLKPFLKLSVSAIVLGTSASIVLSPKQAHSQALPVCPTTNTVTNAEAIAAGGACKGTPTVYGLTFYEMGLCQGNPMASGTFDRTLCTATFTSTAGEYHNIAGATVVLGSDANTVRPANGSYDSPYVVISNVFTLKGSYGTTGAGGVERFSNGTAYADGTSNVAAGISATQFTDTLANFGGGGGGCTSQANDSQSNGTLNAWATDSALNEATTCTGVTRIVGVMTLNSPITIDDTVTGLQVDFNVENNGMTVMSAQPGNAEGFAAGSPYAISSGPFSASFTIIR